jgi:membrane associated rhomboid family serine protease
MGIYDREYYRESERGFTLTSDLPVVTWLIMVNMGLFIADFFFANGKLFEHMALDADLYLHPWKVYQVVTHGFAHGGLWHVVGNMFMLWIFGRDVEVIYGRRQFLNLYFTLVVLAGIGWLLAEVLIFKNTQSSALGASGAVMGIAVVFVIHYPMRVFYIWFVPIPAWILVGLYILSDLMQFHSSVRAGESIENVAYSAHLVGAAFGVLFYKTGWTLGSLLPRRFSLKFLRPRPKLRAYRPPQRDPDLEARVDELLEKINRSGTDSLTAEERRWLEEASRQYQERNR